MSTTVVLCNDRQVQIDANVFQMDPPFQIFAKEFQSPCIEVLDFLPTLFKTDIRSIFA